MIDTIKSDFDLEMEKMKKIFSINKSQMLTIANRLSDDMEKCKYLMMLPSKLYCDNEVKCGNYIALDFGGTNIRICIYSLQKDSKYEMIAQHKFALKNNEHDYLSGDYTLYDIFMVVAENIKKMINTDEHYYLGHSLSRAFVCKDINQAFITKVPNGFNIKQLKENDINDTLQKALTEHKLKVTPVCVINDTTAVLAGGRYLYPEVDMSCVIGTGYNMGMINTNNEIINTESDAFSDFDLNYYDELYVKWRGLPKEECNLMNGFVAPGQKAAIMANIIMEDFAKKGLIDKIENITPQVLSLSFKGIFDPELSIKQKTFIQEVAKTICERGANLIACQIYAILNMIDINLEKKHGVMFEGSTVANVPYIEYVTKALNLLYGQNSNKINCYFKKDIAILGAAVAASMVS